MTLIASNGFVLSFQRKTDGRVDKRCRIEADDLEGSSVMLFMTFLAEFSADRCMVSLLLPYPRINFRVAFQTFVVG